MATTQHLNQGEVPIGGRGAAGRTPSSLQLDMHTEYVTPIKERYTLKLVMDMFNVTNSQFELSRVQFTQTPASGHRTALKGGRSAVVEIQVRRDAYDTQGDRNQPPSATR